MNQIQLPKLYQVEIDSESDAAFTVTGRVSDSDDDDEPMSPPMTWNVFRNNKYAIWRANSSTGKLPLGFAKMAGNAWKVYKASL